MILNILPIPPVAKKVIIAFELEVSSDSSLALWNHSGASLRGADSTSLAQSSRNRLTAPVLPQMLKITILLTSLKCIVIEQIKQI